MIKSNLVFVKNGLFMLAGCIITMLWLIATCNNSYVGVMILLHLVYLRVSLSVSLICISQILPLNYSYDSYTVQGN